MPLATTARRKLQWLSINDHEQGEARCPALERRRWEAVADVAGVRLVWRWNRVFLQGAVEHDVFEELGVVALQDDVAVIVVMGYEVALDRVFE